jgi:hypothetical protein
MNFLLILIGMDKALYLVNVFRGIYYRHFTRLFVDIFLPYVYN